VAELYSKLGSIIALPWNFFRTQNQENKENNCAAVGLKKGGSGVCSINT